MSQFISYSSKSISSRFGIRTDLLASRVDTLLNGSTEFGFGKLSLSSVTRLSPNTDYYGRALKYTVLKREVVASNLMQDVRYKNGVMVRNRSYYPKKLTSVPYTAHDSVVISSIKRYAEWYGYITPDQKYYFVRNPIDGRCGYIDANNIEILSEIKK